VTALVGPLQPVRYATGPTEYHDLPRNTLDIRYEACASHHLACDCREALLAENEGEWRGMFRAIEAALLDAIKGHNTWAYTRNGLEADPFAQCKCQACAIARKCHVGFLEWSYDRSRADRQLYPHQEVPF
jgi:hypothetical protein